MAEGKMRTIAAMLSGTPSEDFEDSGRATQRRG
jgi:hypothetical protein